MRSARSSSITSPRGVALLRGRGITGSFLSPWIFSHVATALFVYLITCNTTARTRSPVDERALRAEATPAAESHLSAAELTCPPIPPPEPCASIAPQPASDAAPPRPVPPPPVNPWLTKQTCFQQPDDSEYCLYDGPVCYGGLGEGLFVLSDELRGMGVKTGDSRATCMDARDFEASDTCIHSPFGKGRAYQPPPASIDTVAEWYWALPSLPTFDIQPSWPAMMDRLPPRRRWGPTNSYITMGHVHPSLVANVTSAEDAEALGPGFAAFLESARGPLPHGLAKAQKNFQPDSLVKSPSRVTWLHGAATFAELSHDSFPHPYHFAVAVGGALWSLRRLNASVEDVAAAAGAVRQGASPDFHFTVGASATGGLLPPLDYIVFPTHFTAKANLSTMGGWTRAMLQLGSQPHTRYLFPTDYDEDGLRVSADHWLCAPRAMVLGQKERVFSGPGDAHAFRLAAYAAANVTLPAWDTHPPRSITLLVRERWREFTNFEEVKAALRGTGLPVRVVKRLSAMSWADQVALFAGTGILIAAHGAAMVNTMFMPKGSVAIEVFSHLGVVPIYGRIAESSRVRYYPLYSDFPSNSSLASGKEGMEMYASARFASECTARNLSSADGPLESYCNLASKRASLEVPMPAFVTLLALALDDIGCRASFCRVPGSTEVVHMPPPQPES